MKLNWEDTRAERRLHQNGGRIFDVYLKIAPMAAESVDAARQAKEGIEVIELVYLRENDATTEVGAGRIHNPVVLIGMPVREILTYGGADAQQIPQNAGANNLCEAGNTGMEAELVAHHGNALMVASQIDQLPGAIERIGQRLLQKNIAARQQTGAGYRNMQAAGVAYVRDIRLLNERFFKAMEGANVVDILDISLLVSTHRWSHHVCETAYPIRDNLDRIAKQGAEIAGV